MGVVGPIAIASRLEPKSPQAESCFGYEDLGGHSQTISASRSSHNGEMVTAPVTSGNFQSYLLGN
jgi:hypothetical protein